LRSPVCRLGDLPAGGVIELGRELAGGQPAAQPRTPLFLALITDPSQS
jgi:hypothetical protein